MKLTELKPQFFRYEMRTETWDTTTGPKTGPREYRIPVDSINNAHCIHFLCPKCFAAAGNNIGVHFIEVTFSGRGVPDEQGTHNKAGKPTRWDVVKSGLGSPVMSTGLDDLTLVPSILIEDCCGWHGYITKGEAA